MIIKLRKLFSKISPWIVKFLPAILLFVGVFFRIIKLSYSEFQGDEIDIQSFLFSNDNFWSFLLSKSKGPGQYLISYLIHIFTKDITNIEFNLRIPFAIAGILVLPFVFLLIKKIYSLKTAIFSLFLTGLSGLLIAFSRIAQYQSFILLFSCLAFYLFYNFIKLKDKKFLILCGLVCGVSLLFHYDSLAFILPILFSLIIMRKFKDLIYFLTAFIVVSLVFYVPFTLSPFFQQTLKYLWFVRVNSDSGNSASETLTIFQLYHSKELLLLLVIGLVLFIFNKLKNSNIYLRFALLAFCISVISRVFSTGQWLETFYYLSILLGVLYVLIYTFSYSKNFGINESIELWFLISFVIYGVIIKFPLTHIYTFFLPFIFIISYEYSKFLNKTSYIVYILFLIVFVSSFSFNYMAFIETSEEYPWQEKDYIFGHMFSDVADRKQVKGVFGFPYNRGWHEIRKYVREDLKESVKTFKSNEKLSISSYYLNYGYSPISEDLYKPDVYIFVKRPQSLVNTIKVTGEPLKKGEDYAIYAKNTYKVK